MTFPTGHVFLGFYFLHVESWFIWEKCCKKRFLMVIQVLHWKQDQLCDKYIYVTHWEYIWKFSKLLIHVCCSWTLCFIYIHVVLEHCASFIYKLFLNTVLHLYTWYHVYCFVNSRFINNYFGFVDVCFFCSFKTYNRRIVCKNCMYIVTQNVIVYLDKYL